MHTYRFHILKNTLELIRNNTYDNNSMEPAQRFFWCATLCQFRAEKSKKKLGEAMMLRSYTQRSSIYLLSENG